MFEQESPKYVHAEMLKPLNADFNFPYIFRAQLHDESNRLIWPTSGAFTGSDLHFASGRSIAMTTPSLEYFEYQCGCGSAYLDAAMMPGGVVVVFAQVQGFLK